MKTVAQGAWVDKCRHLGHGDVKIGETSVNGSISGRDVKRNNQFEITCNVCRDVWSLSDLLPE